jgi:hypothetical protein
MGFWDISERALTAFGQLLQISSHKHIESSAQYNRIFRRL